MSSLACSGSATLRLLSATMHDSDFLDDMAGRLDDMRATYSSEIIPPSWPGALRRVAKELRIQGGRRFAAPEVIEQRARAIDLATENLRAKEELERDVEHLVDVAAAGLAEARSWRPPEAPASEVEREAARLATRVERVLEESRSRLRIRNGNNGRHVRTWV